MKIFLIIILFVFFPLSVDAGRGCCSHHGGVCGCNNYGKETCCDGTTSKSSSCICTPPKINGCTDRNAINYNQSANTNDGSCIYHENEETKSIIDGNIKQVENKENLDNNTETIIFYLLSAVGIYEVFKKN